MQISSFLTSQISLSESGGTSLRERGFWDPTSSVRETAIPTAVFPLEPIAVYFSLGDRPQTARPDKLKGEDSTIGHEPFRFLCS